MCNAGIGTQCKDSKACRGRWYGPDPRTTKQENDLRGTRFAKSSGRKLGDPVSTDPVICDSCARDLALDVGSKPGDPTVRHVVAWMRATYPMNQHAQEWAAEIDRVFLGGACTTKQVNRPAQGSDDVRRAERWLNDNDRESRDPRGFVLPIHASKLALAALIAEVRAETSQAFLKGDRTDYPRIEEASDAYGLPNDIRKAKEEIADWRSAIEAFGVMGGPDVLRKRAVESVAHHDAHHALQDKIRRIIECGVPYPGDTRIAILEALNEFDEGTVPRPETATPKEKP